MDPSLLTVEASSNRTASAAEFSVIQLRAINRKVRVDRIECTSADPIRMIGGSGTFLPGTVGVDKFIITPGVIVGMPGSTPDAEFAVGDAVAAPSNLGRPAGNRAFEFNGRLWLAPGEFLALVHLTAATAIAGTIAWSEGPTAWGFQLARAS